MTISILIITHNRLGADLINTADSMFGTIPMPTRAMAISQELNPDRMMDQAKQLCAQLRPEAGLLILTDAYGSTPSNIAHGLADEENVEIVTGINLPMLIRVFNYPEKSLQELADIAVEGGQSGIKRYSGDNRA